MALPYPGQGRDGTRTGTGPGQGQGRKMDGVTQDGRGYYIVHAWLQVFVFIFLRLLYTHGNLMCFFGAKNFLLPHVCASHAWTAFRAQLLRLLRPLVYLV